MKRLIPLIGLIVLCSSVVIATHSVAAEKIRLSYIFIRRVHPTPIGS